MDVEGPDAGRKVAVLLFGVLHLCWAGCIVFVAYFMYQLDVQGFDSPESVNWPRTVLLLAVAGTSVTAGGQLLRHLALDSYVVAVTLFQLALVGYWLI